MATYIGTGVLNTQLGSDPNNENATKIGLANLADLDQALTVNGLADIQKAEGGITVDLTGGSATKFVSIAIAQSSAVTVLIDYEIYATDGTDYQTRSGTVNVSAVNKAGTVTGVAALQGTEAAALSVGTLTNTFTAVEGSADVLDIKANAASSLTETTLQIKFAMRVVGQSPDITAA